MQTNNFLNNQKFILGEKEKRNILASYISKKTKKLSLKMLSYIFTIIFFLLIIFFIVIYPQLIRKDNIKIIFFLGIILIPGWLYIVIKTFKSIKQIDKIEEYFEFSKKNPFTLFLNMIVYFGLFITCYLSILFNFYEAKVIYFSLITLLFTITMLLLYLSSKNIFNLDIILNIVNIVIFPIVWLIRLFTYVTMKFIMRSNKYYIIKNLTRKKDKFYYRYEIKKY